MRFDEVEEQSVDGLEFPSLNTMMSAAKGLLPGTQSAASETLPGGPVYQADLPWYEKSSYLPVVGSVKRKYLLGGVGVLGVLGFLYYRSKYGVSPRAAMAGLGRYRKKRKSRKGGKRKSRRGKRRGRR